jgi:hypothetical protein
MSRKIVWPVFFAVLILALLTLSATAFGMPPGARFATESNAPNTALGSAFTYQGQLKLNGVPVNSTCSIAFKLFDAPGTGAPPIGGAQVGNTLNQSVTIVDGLFTTQLDFGAVFQGEGRWLEMTPDCGAGAVTLSPRQPLSAAPYALFSAAPWVTSGGNLFYNGGNVGLGTTTPTDAKLVIQVPTGTNASVTTDGNVKLFSRLNPTNGEIGTLTNHDLIFTTGGFTSMQIDAAAGNVFPTGDGVSSLGKSTNRWTAVFAQNGTIQTSDGRWKTAVTDLSYGLSQIMQLRPITFQWKNGSDGQTHLGLIAQEVEKVIPEVVEISQDPALPLGINYSGLEPVLIKAIQEQQATIARNDAEIIALKSDNEALNARLTALEQAVNSGNTASHPASNSLENPWFWFGGLAVLGLAVGKQRRGG